MERNTRLLVALVVGLGLTLALSFALFSGQEARAAGGTMSAPSLRREDVPPAEEAASNVPQELAPATWNAILTQLSQDHPLLVRHTAKLTATDGITDDHFGWAVEVDGDTVAVGAYAADSVYVFSRNEEGADSWGLVTVVTATDASAGDRFGSALALHGDTLVVGAIYDDENGQDSGAAYVFARNQGGADRWGQTAKLTATGGITGDQFGSAVDVSGDTLVVGALYDDDNGQDSGAVYIFARNQGGADGWGQLVEITATDGVTGDVFGSSVAIDGDTVVVGALGDDDAGDLAGAAYVFTRNQGGADRWGQVTKLTVTDGAAQDQFGRAVAVDRDTALVAAPFDDDDGASSGAVYVFQRNQGSPDSWGQVAKITATDGAEGDHFGDALAVDGDTMVAGAYGDDDNGHYSGSTYVFQRNAGGADNWGRVAKLVPPDGAAGDHFGHGVAVDGDTIVAGSYRDDDNGDDSGAAHVFTRLGNDWRQESQPTAPTGVAGDGFGFAVAVDGPLMVIGAPYDDDNGVGSGSAYVFACNRGGADNWGLMAHLSATDAMASDAFGYAVGISGDTVVVGAPQGDGAVSDSGAAYVFTRNQGGADGWGQTAKITAADGTSGDEFGVAVAISGDAVVVGAPSDSPQGASSGSAYVFARNQDGADQWGESAKISPTLGGSGAHFGLAVAVDGDTVVVGAPDADGTGAAYVFARNQGGADRWGQVAEKPGQSSGSGFGRSVDVDAGILVVGAPGEDRAYIFARNRGGADQWGSVRSHSIGSGDGFGGAVAVDGDTVVVGASGDDGEATDAGAAFVFRRNEGGMDNWGQAARLVPDEGEIFDEFGWTAALDGSVILVGAPNDESATVYREVPFTVYLALVLRGD